MELKKQQNEIFTDEYWEVLRTYGKLIPNKKLAKYGKIYCYEPYAEELAKLYSGMEEVANKEPQGLKDTNKVLSKNKLRVSCRIA